MDLGLKKIATLEHEKKKLLLNLLDANELVNKVKTENMMLFDEIKNLELELFVAREQTNRFASSKLDHMLSVQKSPLDKTGLAFVDCISMFEKHSLRKRSMIDLCGFVIFVKRLGILSKIYIYTIWLQA